MIQSPADATNGSVSFPRRRNGSSDPYLHHVGVKARRFCHDAEDAAVAAEPRA
jgi:hypothetical protein